MMGGNVTPEAFSELLKQGSSQIRRFLYLGMFMIFTIFIIVKESMN